MVTMLLGGLWHGANWTFVIWGGYHGVLLVVERDGEGLWGLFPALVNSNHACAGSNIMVLTTFTSVGAWGTIKRSPFSKAMSEIVVMLLLSG